MGLPAATAPPPPPAQHRRQPRPTSGTAPPAAAFTAVSPSSAAGSGTSSSAAITDAATVPLLTSTTLRHILSGGDAAAHGTGGPRTTSAGHAYAPIALSDISVAPPPTTSQIALAALLAPSSSESTVGDPRHDSSDVFHGGGGLSKPLLMSSTTTLPKKGGGGDKDLLADPGILNDGSTPSYARSTASIAPSRGLPVPPPPKNKMLRVPGLRWNWRDRAAAAVQRRWPFVWLLPVLLLVATAVVSYEVWQVMSASQLAAIQRGNEFRSSQLADRIIFELRARLMAPGNTVRGFLANQPSFNQSTLESFCSLTNWSPWLRVTLAPHIKDVDRPQWESDNRRTMSFVNSSLAPGSQSTTVSTNQVQLPLHVKDDYWPTTYIYPYTPELIGADLYTPPRTEALDASLQLPLNDSDHGYFTNPYGMIIPPSKSTHTPPAIGFSYFTAQLVQNNTYWTVNTLFNLNAFMSSLVYNSSLNTWFVIGLSINNTLVFRNPVEAGNTPVSEATAWQNFTVAGQTFMLDCTPKANNNVFITVWPTVTPILVALAGVFLTGGVVHILRRLQRYSETERLLGSWKGYSKAILEATPNAMLIVDSSGKISGINRPLVHMTGRSPDSFVEDPSLMSLFQLPETTSFDLLSQTSIGGTPPTHETLTPSTPFLAPPTPLHLEDGETHPITSAIFLAEGRREVQVKCVSVNEYGEQVHSLVDAMLQVSPPTGHPNVHRVLVITDLTDLKQRDRALAAVALENQRLISEQRSMLAFVAASMVAPLRTFFAAAFSRDSENGIPELRIATDHIRGLLVATSELMNIPLPPGNMVFPKPGEEQVAQTPMPSSLHHHHQQLMRPDLTPLLGSGLSTGGALLDSSSAAAAARRSQSLARSRAITPSPAPPPSPEALTHFALDVRLGEWLGTKRPEPDPPRCVHLTADAVRVLDRLLEILRELPPGTLIRWWSVRQSKTAVATSAAPNATPTPHTVAGAGGGNGGEIATPHTPPHTPLHDSTTPNTTPATYLSLRICVPSSAQTAVQQLKHLVEDFDWSRPAQGAAFSLLLLQVAVIKQLLSRIGGFFSVLPNDREIRVRIPCRACTCTPRNSPHPAAGAISAITATGPSGVEAVGGTVSVHGDAPVAAAVASHQYHVSSLPPVAESVAPLPLLSIPARNSNNPFPSPVHSEATPPPLPPGSTPPPPPQQQRADLVGGGAASSGSALPPLGRGLSTAALNTPPASATAPTTTATTTAAAVADHGPSRTLVEAAAAAALLPLSPLSRLSSAPSASSVAPVAAAAAAAAVAQPKTAVPATTTTVTTNGSSAAPRPSSTSSSAFPLHTEASPACAVLPSLPPPAERTRLTILVVEDNVLVQQVTKRFLMTAGHTVHIADNGRDALEKLGLEFNPEGTAATDADGAAAGASAGANGGEAGHAPNPSPASLAPPTGDPSFPPPPVDVVVMDLLMPICDGYEATRQIRRRWSPELLPVVAVTANAVADEADRCFQAGITAFLNKPVRRNQLVAVVQNAVGWWPAVEAARAEAAAAAAAAAGAAANNV